MAIRYNITMNDNLPAGLCACYSRGAIVDGTHTGINSVIVHAGHDFQIGDKFLYALTRTNIRMDRVFTVTAKSTTLVTFSGAPFTFPDGVYLVPLGTDTGGVLQSDGTYSQVQWDGSSIAVSSDPALDDGYTNANVPVEPGGELGFWTNATDVWAVSRATTGKPVRVYILSSIPAVIVGSIGPAELESTSVTAGSYGSATQVGSFTVDEDGRLTAAANVTIAIPSTQVTDFNEAAQDAVGTILVDSSRIDFTYADGTPSITADVVAGSIGPTHLENTAVTPGSYTNTNLTVDADGRITLAANGSAGGADILQVQIFS